MVTYKSRGDDLYNAMVDYGDNFDDYVVANSPYCNFNIEFELSFPRRGIEVYLDHKFISFSPNGVDYLHLILYFDHMFTILLIYNCDHNYFKQFEIIGYAIYSLFDEDKALSKGLSNYSCNSSLSNEII